LIAGLFADEVNHLEFPFALRHLVSLASWEPGRSARPPSPTRYPRRLRKARWRPLSGRRTPGRGIGPGPGFEAAVGNNPWVPERNTSGSIGLAATGFQRPVDSDGVGCAGHQMGQIAPSRPQTVCYTFRVGANGCRPRACSPHS
jgi:hypothetical protein